MNYNELKTKSLSDDNFAKQMSCKLSNSEERASFFTWISSLGSHWQENPTPFEIIRKMVSKTSLDDKKILVLFNIEFLQVLVEERKINPENIYYIADNDLEYLSAIKIFKVQSYKLNDFSVPALKKLIAGIDMKFDLVFSNPPYNDALDIDIISNVLSNANEMIIIHPSPWLYDKKNAKNTALKNQINNHVKSIKILPVNSFEGIQLPNKLDIIHIDMNYNGDFLMQELDKEPYNFSSILELTSASSEHQIYQPFFDAVDNHISANGSLFNHTIDISKLPIGTLELDGEWYCQLADTIGQPDRPEHFGFLLKDWTGNYGLRKTGLDSEGNPLYKMRLGKQSLESPIKNSFKFSTEQEMHNFIDSLRTDFMRFCLVRVKKNKHLDSGELLYVPWLDFTQSWDDDKLFEHFNITQDTQNKVKEFIPEYYGVK